MGSKSVCQFPSKLLWNDDSILQKDEVLKNKKGACAILLTHVIAARSRWAPPLRICPARCLFGAIFFLSFQQVVLISKYTMATQPPVDYSQNSTPPQGS